MGVRGVGPGQRTFSDYAAPMPSGALDEASRATQSIQELTETDIEAYVAEAEARQLVDTLQEAADNGAQLKEELPPAAYEEIPDGPYVRAPVAGTDTSKETYHCRFNPQFSRMDF